MLNLLSAIMSKDDFAEVQRQLETTASELNTANDPDRRRMLHKRANGQVNFDCASPGSEYSDWSISFPLDRQLIQQRWQNTVGNVKFELFHSSEMFAAE
jgi:hypothetical protein